MVRYRAWAIWPLGNLGVWIGQKASLFSVSRKLCVIIMTPQKVGRLAKENPFYESSFEEGEISSRILHPRKVATEGRQFGYPDAMVHILWFSNGFKGDCQTSKENTNLKYLEIWKSIFRIGTSLLKRNQGLSFGKKITNEEVAVSADLPHKKKTKGPRNRTSWMYSLLMIVHGELWEFD